MPKLDVKVGDEFPAEESGQVHHHYYHFGRRCHGRRGPFGLLRVVLAILLIVFVVRLVGFAWRAPEWIAPYGGPMAHGFYGLGGLIVAIAVIGGILWLLRRGEG